MTSVRTNLHPNPNFEHDTVGAPPALWVGNGSTLVCDNSRSSSGTKSLKVTGTGANTAPYPGYIPVVGGHVYAISVDVNIPVGLSVALFAVGANFYNASTVLVATVNSGSLAAGTTTSGWQRFQIVFKAPDTAVKMLPYHSASTLATTDSFWSDNWMVEDITNIGSELLTNTGFGTDVSGWLKSGTAAATLTRDTSDYHTAPASMKIPVTATGSVTVISSPLAAVTVGDYIYASGWEKLPAGTYTATWTVLLAFYNSSAVFVGYGLTGGSTLAANTGNNGVWTQYSVSGVVPATATQVGIILMSAGSMSAGTNVWYDDLSMKKYASAPGPYFDGDASPTSIATYNWTGTPGASSSQEVTPTYRSVSGTPVRSAGPGKFLLPHPNGVTWMNSQ